MACLANPIEEKLVKSPLVLIFPDVNSLVILRKAFNDPLYYQSDGDYLTGVWKLGNSCEASLLARLITFLKYADPNSGLFKSSSMKSFGISRTLSQIPCDELWEKSVQAFFQAYDALKKHIVLNKLKESRWTRDKCEMYPRLWEDYGVDSRSKEALINGFVKSAGIP
ncbi:unnamed protein product [Heterobilharzia americana]|nr:unnamed protein product [Heterobilharzia americana]